MKNLKIYFFLLIILILLIFSITLNPAFAITYRSEDSWTTTVGNSQINPSIPPPPPAGEIKQAILAYFGLNLVGSYNYEGAKQIYETMSLLFLSSKYADYLGSRNANINIYLGEKSGFGNCTGLAPNKNEIHLYNPLGSGGCGLSTMKYTLSHELGHLVDYRTNLRGLFRAEGVTSEGFLPTYPFKKTEMEDFAETQSDYLTYKVYRGGAFSSFPQRYPKHYKFARDIIFGGIEY